MRVFELLQNRGLTRGMIVASLAGHDRQRVYLVLKVEGSFAWLTDGRLRPLEKPKKKRVSHVKALGTLGDPTSLDELEQAGDSGQSNARIRRLLAEVLDTAPLKEEN